MIRTCFTSIRISIHAPREGGDNAPTHRCIIDSYFNPRPPRGGRLRHVHVGSDEDIISIHAPREGGDFQKWGSAARLPISIHAPREGGDLNNNTVVMTRLCISIHAPREGGDGGILDLVGDYAISIHAPREGGDNVL